MVLDALIFISVRKLGAKLEQLLPGKPVEKTGSKKKNFITDAKYPAFSVFFASVLPVIPNGLIPYVASKTKIGFRSYMLAVMTGCIPTVLTLCAVGDQLVEGDFLSAALYVAPLLLFAGLLLWQRKNILSLYEKIKQRTAEHKAMSHLEQTIGIIIATIAVVLSYCGLAFIGIVSKIIDWFA